MVQPCGGGAAGGLGQAPHRAKGEGFERENPLVSKGMNHTWGWERQLRSTEQKGKGGFDYKRIHKVITRRETRHLGKGRVAGRGRATGALIFMCFFSSGHKAEITQGMLCPGTALPHAGC